MARLVRFEITSQTHWVVARDPETNSLVARCDPLGLVVEADRWSSLNQRIDEAQNTLFRDLVEEHEMEAFLRENGWRSIEPIPTDVDVADLEFDMPHMAVMSPSWKSDGHHA